MLAVLANPHRIKASHRRRRRSASWVWLPGQYFDAETGLSDWGLRSYEAATGRSPQSDPIGLDGGISTYTYVGNNPLNYVDPLGTQILIPVPDYRPTPLPISGLPQPTHNYPKDDPVALCLAMGPPCVVPVAAAAMAGENVLPFPKTKPMSGICPKDDEDGNDRCEQNLKRDLISCKAVAKRGGKQVYEICRQQAMIRYGNCLSGRDSDIDAPLPPW